MATYRNTKTGAIITAESKLSGGDWVLEEKNEKTPKGKGKKTETAPPDEGGSDE